MSHDCMVHCATCGKDVTDYFHGSLGLRYVFALIDSATTITAIAVLGRKLDPNELERVALSRWNGPVELDEFANHDGHHLVAMIDYGKEITRARPAGRILHCMTQEFSEEDRWMGAHNNWNELSKTVESIPPLDRADLETVCVRFNTEFISAVAEMLPLPLYTQIRLIHHGRPIAFRDQEQMRWELAAQSLSSFSQVTAEAIDRFDETMRRCAREKALGKPAS